MLPAEEDVQRARARCARDVEVIEQEEQEAAAVTRARRLVSRGLCAGNVRSHLGPAGEAASLSSRPGCAPRSPSASRCQVAASCALNRRQCAEQLAAKMCGSLFLRFVMCFQSLHHRKSISRSRQDYDTAHPDV